MVINIHTRANELMEQGNLDEQIKKDMRDFIQDRKEYQSEYLDKRVKGKSHHYEAWTKANQAKIKYAERILELVSR